MFSFSRYLLLCCIMVTVSAQDDKTESTSAIVWILIVLLYMAVGAITVAGSFLAYHFHQRFKKIESRLSSRRGSITSDRYSKYDSRRSSGRSITSRYENNPIPSRRSRSPNNPPPPQSDPPQQDQVALQMDAIRSNMQESQQLQQQQNPQINYTQNNAMNHYERLVIDTSNGHVRKEERKQEESQQEQKPQQEPIVGHPHKTDNSDDGDEDVPMITPYDTTYINDMTYTNDAAYTDNTKYVDRTGASHAVSDDNYEQEYADVYNPSSSAPNHKESTRVSSVKKGRRPQSSEEYSDPVHNGVANMKKMKASSFKSKTPDSSATINSEASSKQRRASESVVDIKHRKDFEDWPIRSPATATVSSPPLQESDI